MGKKLGNVSLIPAVEGISRKLALRRETCTQKTLQRGISGQVVIPGHTYMGVISKSVNVIGYGSANRVNLFMRKSTILGPATSGQVTTRSHFAAARRWVVEAQEDLSAITANQTKFATAANDLSKTIEGISARGYQSMDGWMFGIAMAILKSGEDLPSNHQLPSFDA